jgi:hypothetical protein
VGERLSFDLVTTGLTRRPRQPAASLERALVIALAVVTVAVIARTLGELLSYYPYGVDLEIPLRAASRWLAGGQPYLPGSFGVVAGPDLPFLYPPVVLPFVAPLLVVPRIILFPIWTGVCVAAGAFACRRLAMPWWTVPFVLAWGPFAEALLGGNVQVPLFAAFVAVLYRGGGEAFKPRPRDLADNGRPAVADGLLATVIGAVKLSLAHTWLFVLRRRPRGALLGAAIVIGIAIATLPLVGIDIWTAWFGQAGKSGDPNWHAVGWPLSRAIGRGPGLVVTVLSLAAVFVIPVGRAGGWLGILSIVGAPSLHIFGLIFLLPAMLEIRRDVALAAALAIATYTEPGMILGTSLVAVVFVFAGRAPILAARRHAVMNV